jgi:hypothetical protein
MAKRHPAALSLSQFNRSGARGYSQKKRFAKKLRAEQVLKRA